MRIVEAIEDLERAKSKLYDLKVESEADEKWDLSESLDEYIGTIQLVIDTLTDDEMFILKPGEEDNKIICDYAEFCTQKLVVCEHQKSHEIKRLGTRMQCTEFGSCSVAEIDCKCIKK